MKKKILIVGVNWLGDSIMSMPAIEAFKKEHPDSELVIAVKEKLVDLWKLVPHISEIIMIQQGPDGTLKTSKTIKQHSFDRAYILPNSFRAALLPFMASVPRRIGMVGHSRSAMLTEIKTPVSEKDGKRHQSWEYIDIFGVNPPESFPALPEVCIPPECSRKVESLVPDASGSLLALIPGAAFGDEKRWPAEHFCEVGARAAREHGLSVVVLGSNSETDICERIANSIGSSAVSVAGKTNLAEMCALLKKCRFAVSNDCGGMHAAAAMGAGTVAVFGVTDPSKTGPIGHGHRIVAPDGVRGARDISRSPAEAAEWLASISPGRVYSELESVILEQDRQA